MKPCRGASGEVGAAWGAAAGTSGSGRRWPGHRQDLRRGASATDPSPAVLAHVDCESSRPMREAQCEKPASVQAALGDLESRGEAVPSWFLLFRLRKPRRRETETMLIQVCFGLRFSSTLSRTRCRRLRRGLVRCFSAGGGPCRHHWGWVRRGAAELTGILRLITGFLPCRGGTRGCQVHATAIASLRHWRNAFRTCKRSVFERVVPHASLVSLVSLPEASRKHQQIPKLGATATGATRLCRSAAAKQKQAARLRRRRW